MLCNEKIRSSITTPPAAKMAARLVLDFTVLLLASISLNLQAQSLTTSAQNALELDAFTDELNWSANNAFDDTLVQPMYERARQFQEMGSHTEALRLYKDAMHILRINNGLYDESQLELLEAMIESEISLQNWAMVDKHYSYMEYLYTRLYDINDPRLESGLQKVVSWHVNALNVNIDGKRVEHLQQANKLFKMRLQIAQLTLTADDPKLDFLLRNIAICERQLFLTSELNREIQRREMRTRDKKLLADLD